MREYVWFENEILNREWVYNIANTVLEGGMQKLIDEIKAYNEKNQKRKRPEVKVSDQFNEVFLKCNKVASIF